MKNLSVFLKKNSGRNNQGRITVRHRGGGPARAGSGQALRLAALPRGPAGAPPLPLRRAGGHTLRARGALGVSAGGHRAAGSAIPPPGSRPGAHPTGSRRGGSPKEPGTGAAVGSGAWQDPPRARARRERSASRRRPRRRAGNAILG